MEKIGHLTGKNRPETYRTRVTNRIRLSLKTFEIELSRPEGFTFAPGQRIRFDHASLEKDYSLVSTPEDPFLRLCIRRVAGGDFSPLLTQAAINTPFEFSGPYGYFTHRTTPRPTVFVATGTGIAPFVSMAQSGLKDFTILHGVRSGNELYYTSLFRKNAKTYVPCISGEDNPAGINENFHGKVTTYIGDRLELRDYDFYLCGRSDMIRDVILIVDDKFPGSYVYTEIYY